MESACTWDDALRGVAEHLAGEPGGIVRVDGLRGGARAYFAYRFLQDEPRPSLIVASGGKAAERIHDDLRFLFGEEGAGTPFGRRVRFLPAWDVVPFEDMSPPPDVVAARIEALHHLQHGDRPIVVTTAEALLQRVPPHTDLAARHLRLRVGTEVDRDQICERLLDWGYKRVPLVEDRGELAARGGILDVYPPAHGNPLRLQLIGDTIEALHEFDPVSQRLLEPRTELLLLPVREFSLETSRNRDVVRAVESRGEDLEIGREERDVILEGLASGILFPGVEFCLPYFYPSLDSVFDYLPPGALVWIDQSGEVDAALERFHARVEKRAAEREREHHFYPPPESLFEQPDRLRDRLRSHPRIELEPLEVLSSAGEPRRFTIRAAPTTDVRLQREHRRNEISFAPVAQRAAKWLSAGQRVICVASDDAQSQRLARLFESHDVTVERTSARMDVLLGLQGRTVRIANGHFAEGFHLPDERLALITELDIFGESRRRAARRVSVHQLLKSLSELKPEDFVVHLDHGVGLYRGLRHLQVAGTEGDYLHLEYQGGDRLYLPVDRISLVQKYVGADGQAPTLDKLGSGSWERVKSRTKESILAMAQELLRIYAAREISERKVYSSPDDYFREFEAAFPFEETPDQKQAIDDVLRDMGKPRPMDRLVCGDVGYGKTEVALRAAFLAVMDGRQVAILVPTTVLAQQHLNTFRKRFEGYPVRVEMLSRFLTPAQSREVVKGLKDGSVDIVIGTHRLLQKDIELKRLGLLVIDEEHRFGVRHKERIKELRKLVDAITLTATPIPRTLQMSLLGIRDLSVIETPPVDRLAIRTYVTRFDEDIVRDAIRRELERGGQVFFVHNRVENIEVMARHLRQLVPEARIVVGHGQMNEHELERAMVQFVRRDADVLLCTAIIESGLDIPRANTILVNRADHFGLAQLYQLRGRVGRSSERAYAYLMIPGEHLITKDAQKRLKVLQELDDLGGGFRLAAQDLEIRGAGNLLGKQQSGHVAAVGFELYTQMMEDAVRELRGEAIHVSIEPEIALGFPAYVPDSYIPDENQRLVFYRRLAGIVDVRELDEIRTEMQERYGPVPPLVDSFLQVMDLRSKLKECMVLRAVNRNGLVNLQFHPEAPIDVDQLIALAHRNRGKFRLSEDYQLSFTPETRDWDGLVLEIKEILRQVHPPLRGAA